MLAISVAHAADPDRPHLAHLSAYADLADMALAAPVVIAAKVHSVVRVGRKSAPDLAAGARRYLVRADVVSAIIAPGPVPSRIEYLWDVVQPDRPDIDDAGVLLFLAPAPANAGQFRLIAPTGQLAADPGLEDRVRSIVRQSRDPALAGRRIIGVTRAFTTPGTVPGEEETQIFLKTAGSEPVSVVVNTRPGEPKHYGVSFGDTIDPGAGAVAPGTLPWYYLACGLPPQLPAVATAELDEGARATVAADYAFVLAALGPCGRTGQKEASSTPTETVSG